MRSYTDTKIKGRSPIDLGILYERDASKLIKADTEGSLWARVCLRRRGADGTVSFHIRRDDHEDGVRWLLVPRLPLMMVDMAAAKAPEGTPYGDLVKVAFHEWVEYGVRQAIDTALEDLRVEAELRWEAKLEAHGWARKRRSEEVEEDAEAIGLRIV